MSRPRSGLGRGLDALIPLSEDEVRSLQEADVNTILPNPRQPRQKMDAEALQELADSIKKHGLIQPLTVRRIEPTTAQAPAARFQLIAGERRLEAAKLAGLTMVPVIVREDVTEQEALELTVVENVQRADLNPLEQAAAYQQLVEDFELTHEQVAERVGKSRVSVTNTLRLLSLPEQVQDALMQNAISEGHARALLSLDSAEMQLAALKVILSKGLSVRATEEYVRRLNEAAQMSRDAEPPQKDPHIAALEDDFRRSLGTKVELFRSSRGGRVVIYFYSDEELEGIYGTIVRG